MRRTNAATFPVKSRPWPDIVHFYGELAGTPQGKWLLPMRSLVEQIEAADFAGQLFATTSMWVLLVSYLSEFDFYREVLRIDCNPKTGLIEFEYSETQSPLYKRWRKTCPSDEAFAVLVRFLKMKKWFPLSDDTIRNVFGPRKKG